MGVSRQSYAAQRGVSEAAVRKAIATGRITWPARVAALVAAQIAGEMEKQTGKPVRPVMIEAAILPRVLETHFREKLVDL